MNGTNYEILKAAMGFKEGKTLYSSMKWFKIVLSTWIYRAYNIARHFFLIMIKKVKPL
jgi:hypothetical protein